MWGHWGTFVTTPEVTGEEGGNGGAYYGEE